MTDMRTGPVASGTGSSDQAASEIASNDTVSDRHRWALDLDQRIDRALGDAFELLAEAFRTAAWLDLGHASWDAYLTSKGDVARQRIPAGERAEIFGTLRDAGMSNRQIAAAVGVSDHTVARSLSAPNVAQDDHGPASILELTEAEAPAAERLRQANRITIPATLQDAVDRLRQLAAEEQQGNRLAAEAVHESTPQDAWREIPPRIFLPVIRSSMELEDTDHRILRLFRMVNSAGIVDIGAMLDDFGEWVAPEYVSTVRTALNAGWPNDQAIGGDPE